LVGVKKATIRAARVTLAETVSSLMGKGASEGETAAPGKSPAAAAKDAPPKSAAPESKRPPKAQAPKPETALARQRGGASGVDAAASQAPAPSAERPAAPQDTTRAEPTAAVSPGEKERRGRGRPAPSPERPVMEHAGKERPASGRRPREQADDKRPAPPVAQAQRAAYSLEPASFPADGEGAGFTAEDAEALALEAVREDMPEFDLAGADHAALAQEIESVVLRLVEPIVGCVPCRVDIGKDRARISLDCGDASGLLVGREGQTLASVQYLAARIIARKIGGALRLHIDAGNYRERQDDRLKEVALSLAARVKKTHKPQATRPLSAYQRRIVHLALEHDPEVTTRSKGEGAQRRVVVYWNKDAANKAGN
jgi:spoIIIJ-associated protein